MQGVPGGWGILGFTWGAVGISRTPLGPRRPLRVWDEQANPILIPDYVPREPQRAAVWPSDSCGGASDPKKKQGFGGLLGRCRASWIKNRRFGWDFGVGR